jgi:hypothetical protein
MHHIYAQRRSQVFTRAYKEEQEDHAGRVSNIQQ